MKAVTDWCAPFVRDLLDPGAYGLSVIDSIYQRHQEGMRARPPGRNQ